MNIPKDTSLYKIEPREEVNVSLCDETVYLSIDKEATVTILSLMEYNSIIRCPSCKLGAMTPSKNPKRKGAGQCGRCPSFTSLIEKSAREYSAKVLFMVSDSNHLQLYMSSEQTISLHSLLYGDEEISTDSEEVKIAIALYGKEMLVKYSDDSKYAIYIERVTNSNL